MSRRRWGAAGPRDPFDARLPTLLRWASTLLLVAVCAAIVWWLAPTSSP